MPAPESAGWLRAAVAIVRHILGEISRDRVGLIAAGATFFLLLALFPGLAAFVALYGFVANPDTVASHVAFLSGLVPPDGLALIRTQLDALVAAPPETLSLAFVGSFAFAMWSANYGISSLFEAMNVAYDESERRGFIRLTLITFGFTLGTMVLGIALIVAIGLAPGLLRLLGLGASSASIIAALRWPVLLVLILVGIAILYRFGPSRSPGGWREVMPGSLVAAATWVVASAAFSWYLAHFADYNATYGSLGAVVGFLMWVWISVFILIAGAELNAVLADRKAPGASSAKGKGAA